MKVPRLNDKLTPGAAAQALRDYKAHRAMYDARDWEIERIYRQIAKGKIVISVRDSLVRAGFDGEGRPKLAIARSDDLTCRCAVGRDEVIYSHQHAFSRRAFRIPWPGATPRSNLYDLQAAIPRIPPQHRPATKTLCAYHILWEADWKEIPRDPFLLRRIGKDAWIVLAGWDLTDVELSVLRAHG
jgi:hypothetical protein